MTSNDRSDAIARVACPSEMHPEMPHDPHRAIACSWADTLVRAVLATDDPAAVAALAATLAERHPEALLTALTNAGVLTEERAPGVPLPDGRFLVREELHVSGLRTGHRLATVWRELTSDEALDRLRDRLSGGVSP